MIKNRVYILMERVKNPNIVGYDILTADLITGIQKKVAFIPNPKNTNPVKIRTRLVNSKPRSDIYSRVYGIKHKAIIEDQDHVFKIIINGVEVNRDMYVLDDLNQQVVIYIVINDHDEVEAEYYIDGVELEFISEQDERYVVKPVVDDTSVFIGKHNILV